MGVLEWVHDALAGHLGKVRTGVGMVKSKSIGWTGYSRVREEMVMRARLEEICRGVVNDPVFIKRDITGDGIPETFCNQAVNRICIAHKGYYGFSDPKNEAITANAICRKVATDPQWRKDSAERAQEWANKGELALAAWSNPEGNGHVAVVFPGEMVMSGAWRMKAPMIANVGKTNQIMSANYGFSEPPEYFRFVG